MNKITTIRPQKRKVWKYPTKRQIWFRRNENLLMVVAGVIVAGLCVLSFAYFNGVL